MRRLLLASLVVLGSASPAAACLWDSDTRTVLKEQGGEEPLLPSLEDAVLGRYEVHSPDFYERRRDRLEARARGGPLSQDDYDDLAVAHERLGAHARAASLMAEKDARYPGRYTTEANWGTFLVHGGELEAGLAHLLRALEINPAAHFGRERYQVQAIRWAIAAKVDPAYAERSTFLGPLAADQLAANGILLLPSTAYEKLTWVQEDAWTAVVGMLKLGGKPGEGWHELYFVLGELLLAFDTDDPALAPQPRTFRTADFEHAFAKRGELAWMAFERAREAGSPRTAAIDRYQALVSGAASPEAYAQGRAAARRWIAAHRAREREILTSEKDPADETLWADFYARNGKPRPLVYPVHATTVSESTRPGWAALGKVVLVAFGLSAVFMAWVLCRPVGRRPSSRALGRELDRSRRPR